MRGSRHRPLWILGLTALLSGATTAGGCGGDSTLDPAVVSALPVGSATGTEGSGKYHIDLYVTACSGNCPQLLYGIFTVSTCDIAHKDSTTATLTQVQGALQVDLPSDILVTRMKGGINLDGSFDVGGVGTQLSGALTVSARANGHLLTDKTLTGSARARGTGTINGVSIDCTAAYDMSGKKL
jgi:hypothetical protein